MSHCDSVIRSLEDHASRLNKEAIIEAQAEADNQELFEGFRMALDPMITFGVKKVPSHGGGEGQGLPWVAFKELARALALDPPPDQYIQNYAASDIKVKVI